MIFPILKEYKVTMRGKQTNEKIVFFNYSPDNIRASVKMAEEKYPHLRLEKIVLERVFTLEDCLP